MTEDRLMMVLALPNDSLAAFEVLYHWLYSCTFHEPRFYQGTKRFKPSSECFWLEVYLFAKRSKLLEIQIYAFEEPCRRFNPKEIRVPDREFIDDLFEECYEQLGLRRYMVRRTA